jgi:hypothetical protein
MLDEHSSIWALPRALLFVLLFLRWGLPNFAWAGLELKILLLLPPK